MPSISAWACRLPCAWCVQRAGPPWTRWPAVSTCGRARAVAVLSCVFVTSAPTSSAPQKSLPEVPGLSFFLVPSQGYFEARLLTGLFFLFGLNYDIRREGSPRTAMWVFFALFRHFSYNKNIISKRQEKTRLSSAPTYMRLVLDAFF